MGEYGSEIEIIMQTFDIDQASGDNLYVATGEIIRDIYFKCPIKVFNKEMKFFFFCEEVKIVSL